MGTYLSYMFLALLILLLAIGFKIYLCFENSRMTKLIQNERRKIQIIEELISLSTKIRNSSNNLESAPNVKKYLSKVDFILENYSFNLDGLTVVEIKGKSRENHSLDIENFYSEFSTVPVNIKVQVVTLSNIMGEIYSLKHPIKYRIASFKKKVQMRIFSSLVDLVLEILCREEENKRRYIPPRTAVVYA